MFHAKFYPSKKNVTTKTSDNRWCSFSISILWYWCAFVSLRRLPCVRSCIALSSKIIMITFFAVTGTIFWKSYCGENWLILSGGIKEAEEDTWHNRNYKEQYKHHSLMWIFFSINYTWWVSIANEEPFTNQHGSGSCTICMHILLYIFTMSGCIN